MTIEQLRASLADRYRLEQELGQGGMATVYLAHDLRHDRKVAIKILRPELGAVIGADRFLSEIRTTANLQHPHILPLHDSGEAGGLVYYVMPYVEGESLRDRLSRERQLPVDDAVRLAGEVAAALDYAHRHGVVHRDIKPENILLHDGSALVADFGIALAVSRSEGGTRLTETGMSLGTPHYMAPEQAMGEREITPRADIYALGCVLYEMLAGEPPFTGPTAQAIIARVMTEPPRSLVLQRRTVPPHVEATVARALEKLPADRFGSAAQFAEALSRPGATTIGVASAMAGRSGGRRRWLVLAPAGVALLALGAAAGAWLRRPNKEPTSWQYTVLSDSVTVSAVNPYLAVSRDGKSVVFRESRPGGSLWIKRAGQLSATPIPGTERARGPTFSPDGDWIAFLADGQVKKVGLVAGSPITVADSSPPGDGYNVAWLDDGTLVYPPPHADELYRINASGGARTVALADSTLRGYGLQHLEPLPHARGVLFTACGSGCVPSSLHVLDLRTGRQKLLLNDMLAAWYLPTGQLLYLRRDGVALAAPFDLDRLEITGPGVPVLDRVLLTGLVAGLAVSPSGTLLYLTGGDAAADFEFVRVNRAGAAVPLDTSWFGSFNSSALSPDGRRLAVGVGRAAGAFAIWTKQLDHGPFSRLTFGGRDRRPTWSPDGRMVAFVRDSGNGGSVYGREADGSGTDQLLVRLDRPVQEVEWSPDGRWLLLRTDNGSAGAGDVVGVRLTGDTTPVPLLATPFTELHPTLSPDTKWLAYTSNESGTQEVYVRPFPGTVSGGRWQISTAGGSEPRWSRDGRQLYFIGGAGRLIAAEVRTSPGFGVLQRQTLFDLSGYSIDPFHQSYEVMPDGKSFLFLRNRQGAQPIEPRTVLVEHWFTDLRARTKN